MFDMTAIPAQVSAVFDGFSATDAAILLDARDLILSEAARLDVGPVTETLKWGQPAYLVKPGTTIRLGLLAQQPALFVHCQTNIIENARATFGASAEFSGTRALMLGGDAQAATHVICAALTYRRR